MAITNARMQMRRGQEVNFDPDKMLPGEWSVSLDTKYVRMCFSPGVCVRMATYEAFENDMAQIQSILAETKNIQSAIQRIQSEVNAKAQLTIENANSAQESADRAYEEAERAKMYANQASAIVGVDIDTESVPGLMAGGDNAVENGILTLTKVTTDRTLIKSHAGGLKVNSIEGESQQKQYTGKNLYNNTIGSQTVSGITLTRNEDKSVRLTGTPTITSGTVVFYNDVSNFLQPNTEYIFSSGNPVKGAFNILLTKVRGGLSQGYITVGTIAYNTNSATFSVTEEQLSEYPYLIVTYGVVNTEKNVDLTVYPMIRLASVTDATYEPYVGGTASPNPDYQQEIESVEVGEMWTVGKNLLKIDVSGRTSNGIEWVCDQKTGTIKANGTASANSLLSTIRPNIKCYGETVVISAENGNPYMQTEVVYNDTSDAKKTIYFQTSVAKTVNNVKTILAITYYVAKGDTVNNLSFKPMIRFANTDDSYETYHEKVIQLSNPITLRGIGDVKDVLCKQDGVYGVLRNIKHLVLNGSEGWAYNSTNTDGTIMNYLLLLTDSAPYDNHVLCDKFAPDSNSISSTTREGIYLTYAQRLFIRINKERAGTAETFRTWLSENNPIVDYELATPTFEKLPTADQIALHQLETFGTVTYISTDSTIEPIIEMEYGTSVVGAYALKGMQTADANKLEIELLKTTAANLSAELLESEA